MTKEYKYIIERSKEKDFDYFLKQEETIELPEQIWDQVYDNYFETNKDHLFKTDDEYDNYHYLIKEFAKKIICLNAEKTNTRINRVIIAGGAEFNDYSVLEKVVDDVLTSNKVSDVEIVSGHAKGTDTLGEKYAVDHNYKCAIFPADWAKYGRAAGPIRNKQMLDYAKNENPMLIAFWNGTSKGTKNMIKIALKANIRIVVFDYVNRKYLDSVTTVV